MSSAAASPSRAILEVESASKSYGTLKALDQVSFALQRGEYVVLLGPNGAGKSTLFQLLSGLFVADRGDISVNGHDIRREPVAGLAELGIVFQAATLDLDLTVQANLKFHARLHGMRAALTEARIEAELGRLGISDQADRPCRTLSGGNRRKVELARALLHEPKLLLMDEATVGLDPASRRLLLDYVQKLCSERGMAVLWATHLVDEAQSAHRVLILHKGRLISEGTSSSLVKSSGESNLADAFLKLTRSEGKD